MTPEGEVGECCDPRDAQTWCREPDGSIQNTGCDDGASGFACRGLIDLGSSGYGEWCLGGCGGFGATCAVAGSFPMHENPCRLYEGTWTNSWPYEPGIQVFRGELLHKGRYIDRKRTIESAAALDVKRKLRKIYELAPVMVRLLESQGDQRPSNWMTARNTKEQLFKEFDLDNVNALDAERVYLIGEGHTYRRTTTTRPGSYDRRTGKWTAAVTEEEPIEEYRKRCVVNGLRKLREHIYSKEGVYQYEPVIK
jgi:hypothetical protein